ncbi:uncharacterized protein LOC122864564 [Siniperca chuatsi]|uniref:uncharacterized protein LOC122864564 n=1 Tax=Siniperca chuatsi TaxID=119488 RepID=UPI001CE08A20|nr:uncharacterized protein LOC122864564 [Siniperca chuatsi]
MPEHTINVAGKDIVFLVDSGATDSVIRESEFAVLPKMSGRFVRTVGVSGTPLVERYTTPLPCSEEIEKHFKHSFLLSKRCPINIIGRDMMIRLGIILISTPEGIIVARISDTASQYVKHSSMELMYSYQWKVPHTAAGSVNNTLITEVTALFPDNYTRIDIKSPQELHCTSHVHLGVDKHFEDTWFRQDKERNTLKLTWLYRNDKRCTVSVAFNDPLCKALFQVPNTYPHVPLVKAKQDTWECLGPWTRRCEEAAGWVKTSDSGGFSQPTSAGVIIPCAKSPVRTPIFPVRKLRDAGEPQHWRFVQDLQAVNAAVHARAPNVPNPHTILSQVPPGSKWFSVVDLANAFFSIPVDPDSQYWFAFSFEGKSFTFTRLVLESLMMR